MEQVHGFWKWGRAKAQANGRPVGLGDIQLQRSPIHFLAFADLRRVYDQTL